MHTINRKKSRLRVVLIVALALGASSATLSGTLVALTSHSDSAAVA